MTDGVSDKALQEFNSALKEYLQYNRRELGPLIENRGRKVQWALFRQFKAIAPSGEKIERDAVSRGHRLKRRMGPDGKHLSYKKELALRKRSIRYLSVSFLYRAWRLNREGQNSAFDATARRNRKIGEAVVRTARGQQSPSVRLTSLLEGAVIQNRQRSLVDKALRLQAADMKTYVQRKQSEKLEALIRRNLSPASL